MTAEMPELVATPGVIGGDLRIAGTRISARNIGMLVLGGTAPRDVSRLYPTVTAADAAWAAVWIVLYSGWKLPPGGKSRYRGWANRALHLVRAGRADEVEAPEVA